MQLAALGLPPQCIARFSGARLALGCSLDGVLAKRHHEPRTLERAWLGLARDRVLRPAAAMMCH